MSTLTARAGPRAMRVPWTWSTQCTVGVEAGCSGIRVAERRLCGEREEWSLASMSLPPGDLESSWTTGSRLIKLGRRTKAPRGSAVCAISSPAVDIFPLSLQPTDSEPLEALIVSHARKLLSVPLDDVVLDYVPLPDWVKRPSDEMSSVLVFCVPRQIVEDLLHKTERLGMNVSRLLTPACALAPQVARADPEARHLIVATSEEATSISVVQRGNVLLERILPWSLQRLIELLRADLDLGERQSRGLLARWDPTQDSSERNDTPAQPVAPFESAVREVLAPAFRELTSEAAGCLGYCGSFLQHAPTSGIILAGPLANHALLRSSLEAELGLPVRAAEEVLRVEGIEGGSMASYATAVCCALWQEVETA